MMISLVFEHLWKQDLFCLIAVMLKASWIQSLNQDRQNCKNENFKNIEQIAENKFLSSKYDVPL